MSKSVFGYELKKIPTFLFRNLKLAHSISLKDGLAFFQKRRHAFFLIFG